MGLRLATPDGRRITHVSRWVLRCSACFFVTKVSLPCLTSCWGR
jgi:RNA-binding protein NOB1